MGLSFWKQNRMNEQPNYRGAYFNNYLLNRCYEHPDFTPYLYLEMISENTYKGGNEGLEWIYTGGIS